MIVVELIYNLSVIVTLSVLSGFLNNRVNRASLIGKILQGVLFGVTAIIGMSFPFELTNGIIFDGRSIVISLCALFFGPLSGLIAAIMAVLYRIFLGGTGILMGILVISSSFLIGYLFYSYRRKKPDKNITGWQFYIFGVIVQSFMLLFVFALPSEKIIQTYQIVSLTILGIYPLVTILIGKILIDQEQNENFISTLKEKEKLYRTTLYSIGDGVITTDETGKVVNMNMVAESLTGWKEKEAAGKSLNEVFTIINEETKLKVENPVEKVLIKGVIVGLANHTILISKKGNKIPIADSAAPIKNSDGKIIGVVLVFRDQTVEREFNKELKERERKFSTLVSNLPGFVYRCALDKDWTMEYISEGCFDITGYKPEDFINNNVIAFNDLIHKEYQKPIWDKWIQVLKDKQTFEYEYPIYTKQNNTRWIWERGRGVYSEDGILLFLEGFITDVTDRKINEIEVIRQKEKAQNYLDVAEVMMIAINNDQTIAMINRKGCEVLGYKENELIGKNWFDLCMPENIKENVKTFFNKIISGELQQNEYFENAVVTKKGNIRIIGWHNNLLKDDEGNIIGTLSSGMDITEQKKLQAELETNEKKFRSLFEDHSAVKLIIDPETKNIIDANKSAEEFYGWSIAELKKMNISQINILSKAEIKNEIGLALLRSKTSFEFKHRIADGSIRDVEVYSSKITINGKDYLHSIVHDITKKKKAEQELQKYVLAIQQNPVSIIITDANRNIEYVNPKFTESTGYTFEEVRSKNAQLLKSEELSNEEYKDIWNTVNSGKAWIGELHSKKKNGAFFWERATVSAIINDKNIITNYIAIKEDITEQKKLTDELIRAKDKAEEMNRIKSYFFANMSHELRTPFVGILGFSELLVESLSDPDFKGYAEQILKSAKRLTDTLNKILNLTRLEFEKYQPNFTDVDVNKSIIELASLYTQTARVNNSIIKTNLLFENHNIKSDKKLLDEILTNLINNAVKFTNNGVIEITSRSIKTDDKDALEIIVSDTGIGIPKNMQEIIWQEFRQASEGYSRTFEGTGLGLTITKKYVDLLRGEISLQSELGIGTVFTIHFPLDLSDGEEIKTENIATVQISETKDNKMGNIKPKLLYVEDDVVASNFIEIILKSEYEIDIAFDAKTTLEKVEKNHYDILMIDINLGRGMDGIELLEKIRMIDYYKNIPAVAVTAYASHNDKTEFLAKGFTHYISKPFLAAELKNLLAEIFN